MGARSLDFWLLTFNQPAVCWGRVTIFPIISSALKIPHMADEEQSTCICDTYVHHCWEGLWFFFFLLDFGVSERYVYLK